MGWCCTVMNAPYLLQLTIMSSGRIRRFSMPILGWSPLPRNKPGGSIRKLAMRSLWLSITQKPYSCRRRSFSSLIFLRWKKESLNRDKTPRYFTNNYFILKYFDSFYQFLFFSHGLPGFGLSFEIFAHFRKVTLIQIWDFGFLFRRHFLKWQDRARLIKVTHLLKSKRGGWHHGNITFLQSLKKFFRNISLVVYSWSNIFAKKVATSSAPGLSFICLPGDRP